VSLLIFSGRASQNAAGRTSCSHVEAYLRLQVAGNGVDARALQAYLGTAIVRTQRGIRPWRQVSFTYKGRAVRVQQVGQELGVVMRSKAACARSPTVCGSPRN
jgi:hypothetical protein